MDATSRAASSFTGSQQEGHTEVEESTQGCLQAAIEALTLRMQELNVESQHNLADEDSDYDYDDSDDGGGGGRHLLFDMDPFGPPQAFCEPPDCPGPDPKELWLPDIEGSPERGLADVWEGIAGLGLLASMLGLWWLAAEISARPGRFRLSGILGHFGLLSRRLFFWL
eukprot:TRINITY_DN1796_c2_g1_i1.p1 TRINITY_DN1796_c2_g1~~TRINITY_DN1796_c2_g1_i1.p1  ORF type:complete len:168 (+),score=29.85 TRINITY_DN1796_c2_g1_i1:99-602(+)